MAHDLRIINGNADMAYVGEKPWHGLGNKLSENANIETWTRESGMDFEIKKTVVEYGASNGAATFRLKYPGQNVLYRSDNGDPLSVVSDQYQITQPGEVMEFFADLTDHAGLKMETAGVLKNGQVYWALANTNNAAEVMPGDELQQYVLLASSCDKSLATIAQNTSIRVVCRNTLNFSLAGGTNGKNLFRQIHTKKFDAEQAKECLGLNEAKANWQAYIASLRGLSRSYVADSAAKKYFKTLLAPDAEKVSDPDYKPRGFETLWETYQGGIGQDGITGTGYGLVNAVTRYVDHERNQGNPEGRMHSALFAQGAALKWEAFGLALKVAEKIAA